MEPRWDWSSALDSGSKAPSSTPLAKSAAHGPPVARSSPARSPRICRTEREKREGGRHMRFSQGPPGSAAPAIHHAHAHAHTPPGLHCHAAFPVLALALASPGAVTRRHVPTDHSASVQHAAVARAQHASCASSTLSTAGRAGPGRAGCADAEAQRPRHASTTHGRAAALTIRQDKVKASRLLVHKKASR